METSLWSRSVRDESARADSFQIVSSLEQRDITQSSAVRAKSDSLYMSQQPERSRLYTRDCHIINLE